MPEKWRAKTVNEVKGRHSHVHAVPAECPFAPENRTKQRAVKFPSLLSRVVVVAPNQFFEFGRSGDFAVHTDVRIPRFALLFELNFVVFALREFGDFKARVTRRRLRDGEAVHIALHFFSVRLMKIALGR